MTQKMDQHGVIESGKLNEVIIVETKRKNGSIRIQQDFKYCPTMAEQHTAHLTNINYLIEKYKPDELAAYMAARAQYKQEIEGHDFSQEPDLQSGMNTVYRMKQAFQTLPDEIKSQFKNHLEFLKFVDNPANQEKMIALGLLNKKEIKELTQNDTEPNKEPAKKTKNDKLNDDKN